MSRIQAEGVIKNIIREIAQDCACKGQAVSETLVAFMVKSVVLHPDNNFNVNRALTKDDVSKLIKLCVDKLMNTSSPSLDTVKMQVYFDMNYTSRSEFLDEHRRILETRMQPVIREITDSRARTRDELENLYRKIVSVILLRSGLGSPVDITVVRETTAALQSVFPQTEMGTFMSLTKKDKERQLSELTMIVTGIRLYNKDCGKGGEAIDDLTAILNEAVPTTTMNVDADLQLTLTSVYEYTALLENIFEGSREYQFPPTLLKEAMINGRQHEHFLRILLTDIITSSQRVEMLENELTSRMEQLKATIQSKTAVPTAQVYPQFMHLSNIWTGFQDEMVLLSVLTNILFNLQPFTKRHREIFSADVLEPHLQGITVMSDEDRLKQTIEMGDLRGLLINYPNIDWVFPESTKNFDKIVLQYKGFCAWALAKQKTLLIPGNPNIGVLLYKDKYFAFSSKFKACEFAENPESFIFDIIESAKRNPEIIPLLELHTYFSAITPYTKKGVGMIEKPVTKRDSGTQTDTHFIEYYKDHKYEWNEWELRRKALKLTNLRQKLTKSMQADLSHFRRDVITQTYEPRDSGMQTKKDSYSNVPKPQVFLAGLRGTGLGQHTQIVDADLTVDVEEQLFLNSDKWKRNYSERHFKDAITDRDKPSSSKSQFTADVVKVAKSMSKDGKSQDPVTVSSTPAIHDSSEFEFLLNEVKESYHSAPPTQILKKLTSTELDVLNSVEESTVETEQASDGKFQLLPAENEPKEIKLFVSDSVITQGSYDMVNRQSLKPTSSDPTTNITFESNNLSEERQSTGDQMSGKNKFQVDKQSEAPINSSKIYSVDEKLMGSDRNVSPVDVEGGARKISQTREQPRAGSRGSKEGINVKKSAPSTPVDDAEFQSVDKKELSQRSSEPSHVTTDVDN